MSKTLIKVNEATAAKRRVYFDLRDATDGITPETGESAGQPQVSANGGAWTNTGIGTLTHIGNGRYYADLTQAVVATAGDLIETRFKSANTAESPGDSIQVVGFDPSNSTNLGLSALPTANPGANGGLPTVNASNYIAGILGFTPWTTTEMQQFRYRIGLDGTQTLPTSSGDLSDIKIIVQAGRNR